ncbi:hypothetical protein [Methylosinus sporium]|uniref:hypothetical protein n=1 Tax=Methylosinus sporium TaxID=428 RepID=UPI0011B1CBAF|nr:hypothetical protein [Methylosinus sporium]
MRAVDAVDISIVLHLYHEGALIRSRWTKRSMSRSVAESMRAARRARLRRWRRDELRSARRHPAALEEQILALGVKASSQYGASLEDGEPNEDCAANCGDPIAALKILYRARRRPTSFVFCAGSILFGVGFRGAPRSPFECAHIYID